MSVIVNNEFITEIEFIKYISNIFKQGTNGIINKLTFDNEMPEFEIKLDKFFK